MKLTENSHYELVTIVDERISNTLILKTTLVDYFTRFYFVRKGSCQIIVLLKLIMQLSFKTGAVFLMHKYSCSRLHFLDGSFVNV